MNRFIGIGRVTKDIDLRTTTSGISVASFTLAVNRNYKNDKGEYEADFINCVAYKNLADIISKYVSKGNKLAVEGRLQVRNYDNKEGKKVYVTEVIVDNIDFIESKKETKEKKDPFEAGSIKAEDLDMQLPF